MRDCSTHTRRLSALDTVVDTVPHRRRWHAGLFAAARVGAFIIMMDASHRLWPSVVDTAAPLGWRASIPTRRRGPFTAARAAKHTLVLQRTAVACAPDAGQDVQAQLAVFARHLSAHVAGSVGSSSTIGDAKEADSSTYQLSEE